MNGLSLVRVDFNFIKKTLPRESGFKVFPDPMLSPQSMLRTCASVLQTCQLVLPEPCQRITPTKYKQVSGMPAVHGCRPDLPPSLRLCLSVRLNQSLSLALALYVSRSVSLSLALALYVSRALFLSLSFCISRLKWSRVSILFITFSLSQSSPLRIT